MSESEKVWIGFDLGGTKMLAVVYDGEFRALGKSKQKTQGHKGVESGLGKMEKTIREALEDAGIAEKRIAGIGVGCPGPVHRKKGEIVEAPNLGWNDAPVAAALGAKFGCEVVLSNDVDAGVYAEYLFGAGRGSDCLVGIFPGTGIGAGAVIEGSLLQGGKLSCMELGHIPLYPEASGDGEHSSTLEMECSRLKIASEAARAAYRGLAPHLFDLCGTDIANITSGKLAKAIEAGDRAVEEIVRKSAVLLGCGVATVVHLLAPDTIVLGGGLVEAMPDLYLKNVRESARTRVLGPYLDSYRIVPAELEDDAGVRGAAAWAKHRLEA